MWNEELRFGGKNYSDIVLQQLYSTLLWLAVAILCPENLLFLGQIIFDEYTTTY